MQSRNVFLKVATCFGLGNVAPAPGTAGSVVAFLLLPVLYFKSISFVFLFAALPLFLFFTKACNFYEQYFGKKDPKEVIIDEFFAQSLVFALISITYKNNLIILCLISFFLFRFFDILKPWPICIVEKKFKGGFGIMVDDIVAGFFSFAVVALISKVF